MNEGKNILLCGVGGQGTILASKLLSHALLDAGYDIKMSEIHGMSQRGGSVVTQVRYGKQIWSPIIGKGSADILVSFEAMEALRYAQQLRPGGIIVTNNHRIPTATTLSGAELYPEDVILRLKAATRTYVLDAAGIAHGLGSAKAMNVVLLGALIQLLGLENLNWDASLVACVKSHFLDLNRKALAAGMAAVE